MKLSDFLIGKEWYDNTKLSTLIACPRKGFYNSMLSGGLQAGVGPGADFGTCMHGAIASYYAWWGKASEPQRRVYGLRTFAALHETVFTGERRESMENKHSVEAGLANFDFYCDTYLAEDSLLQPIEIELSGAVLIEPQGDEFFEPFWYVFRIDGIHKRITYGDYWIRETKTTSAGVEREIKKLELSRQARGYLYCARQFPGTTFTGIMPDVVGVFVKNFGCQREYYPKPMSDSDIWRDDTVEIVEQWRAKRVRFDQTQNLSIFYQQTGHCTEYGLCGFYDLCNNGINRATLAKYQPNTWNPLDFVDAAIPEHEPLLIETDKTIKESVRLI